MHYSTSKTILELAFLDLKNKALLYEGQIFYSELKKNTLKGFLKSEWHWNKKQTIQAIKEWRSNSLLRLNDNDCLEFIFTEVNRLSNYYITEIKQVKEDE